MPPTVVKPNPAITNVKFVRGAEVPRPSHQYSRCRCSPRDFTTVDRGVSRCRDGYPSRAVLSTVTVPVV